MSPARHPEVERKYDVSPDCAVPDLTQVAGVATVTDPEPLDQVATYYDSPDLRLLRARVTLRRRSGGLLSFHVVRRLYHYTSDNTVGGFNGVFNWVHRVQEEFFHRCKKLIGI